LFAGGGAVSNEDPLEPGGPRGPVAQQGSDHPR
jgi:hypothetical protein